MVDDLKKVSILTLYLMVINVIPKQLKNWLKHFPLIDSMTIVFYMFRFLLDLMLDVYIYKEVTR